MNRTTIVTLVILVSILAFAGWFAYLTHQKNQEEAVSAKTPVAASFAAATNTAPYTDISGNQFHAAEVADSVIVAHSWATWVPGSQKMLRDLDAVQREFAAQGVKVLAMNRKEPQKTVRQFLQPLAITDLQFIGDSDDRFYQSIDGRAMPETIFYNRAGEIVRHHQGLITVAEIRQYTKEALAVEEL